MLIYIIICTPFSHKQPPPPLLKKILLLEYEPGFIIICQIKRRTEINLELKAASLMPTVLCYTTELIMNFSCQLRGFV